MPFVGGKVADIGCGPCVMWEGKNVDLTGVDFSAEALKQAGLHYPSGKYVLADACSTGLPSEEFDTVIMLGVLDYYEDWTLVVKEAKRICKKEGKIFATLLHGFEGHDWSKRENIKFDVKSYCHVTSNWYLVEL